MRGKYWSCGFVLPVLVLIGLFAQKDVWAQSQEDVCDPTAPPNAGRLCKSEVEAILQKAAAALDVPLTIAVVDRVGNILGVLSKPGAPTQTFGNFPQETTFFTGGPLNAVEVALSLARTGAFFSNNQAPLSSRTVRFISGVHFPPGVMFTPNAALYGIENTNRGCEFNVTFNPGKEVPRAKALNGGPCNNGDRTGCSLGITTGKADLSDSDANAVNPGGVPIFKGDVIVGGVGVTGDIPEDLAEFAAFVGAFMPPAILPVPAAFTKDLRQRVFIDGIRLPFVLDTTIALGLKGARPKGTAPGTAEGAELVVSPQDGACYDLEENQGTCRAAPEGYLVGPLAGSKLTLEEVDRLVQQSRETAERTRAQIRLPLGSRTGMMIAVSDVDGTLLAVYRMPDATIFSIDVSTAKARNVVYFSSFDPQVQTDLPGLPAGTAVTNRTISFGSQPFYPAGIDTSGEGPFFRTLYARDTLTACTQGTQTQFPENQSGIVFFPGGSPLYRDEELVGGLGISGDGVEQDDYVTAGGIKGFEAPARIRADQFFVRGVRSAYFKFPRNPEK
jgi:uncharacterized protein GlcG (DUF336 family)